MPVCAHEHLATETLHPRVLSTHLRGGMKRVYVLKANPHLIFSSPRLPGTDNWGLEGLGGEPHWYLGNLVGITGPSHLQRQRETERDRQRERERETERERLPWKVSRGDRDTKIQRGVNDALARRGPSPTLGPFPRVLLRCPLAHLEAADIRTLGHRKPQGGRLTEHEPHPWRAGGWMSLGGVL